MPELQHILVVEDDRNILDLIGECLEVLGYRVSKASRGDAARPILDRMDVDLLVADELMFGESGHHLAEYARSLGIPTLLMSAHNEIKQDMEATKRDFIGKPFRLGEFHKQVTGILARPKLQGASL
jgi:two-component system OmpR family response regulator